MAVKENTGETLTSDGTEQTLATLTAAGTYQLLVDTDEMVGSDAITLRIKVKARSGNTLKEVFAVRYRGDQGDNAIKISPPVPAPFEFVATLEKTDGGASRDFIWSIAEY